MSQSVPQSPEGWIETTLRSVADITGGVTKNSSKKGGELYPYLRVANVYADDLRLEDVAEIRVSDAELDRVLLRRGDLLVVEGNGSVDQIGRVALWDGPIDPCVHQNHLIKVRCEDESLPRFVLYWLLSPGGREAVVRVASSTSGLHTLSLSKVSSLPLRLAPAALRDATVAVLDSYLSRLDDAVATLERVQRNLKRYRASVLKAAVEGRLVPTEAELARQEGRDYEPADVLLQRILEERKARWIEDAAEKARARAESKAKKAGKPWSKADDEAALEKGSKAVARKYQPPEPPDTSELPELPEGWCWTTIEQIGLVTGGLTKNASKRRGLPLQMPYLRVANVYADELRLHEVKTIGVTPHEQARATLKLGDLLVVEGNGSIDQIGRVAIWDGSIEDCAHQNHLIRVRLADAAWSRWCLHWLLSPTGRQVVVKQASSTSGLHTLSLSKVEGLAIPICPVDERDRISHEVDRLISLGSASGDYTAASAARARRVRQSILKWAFEGRLVDQDPNDEPASVLLERIAAEREKAEANGGKKKRRTKSRKKKTA